MANGVEYKEGRQRPKTQDEIDSDIAWFWIVRGTGALALATASIMWGCPHYSVWEQNLAGEAELVRAAQTRQILIEQAKAEETAATHRAKAIAIVGQAAKSFPEYRQQEFMAGFGEALREGKVNQIIYVPTEANVPIMEAGRVRKAE